MNVGIAFVVRGMMVMLFLPFSALDKILNARQAVGQAAEIAPTRSFAIALIAAGFCVEVVMSLAILTGIADRLAAFILAGYCVVTALLWKQFWKTPDFRLKGESRGRDLFWDFLKNLAVAGGFLLLAFGPNASGLQAFLEHPLASSNPYTITSAGAGG